MRTSSRGAVRIVRETGKPIAQVARELGLNEGTLGNLPPGGVTGIGYGWLGTKQRATLGDTGLTLMGARVYQGLGKADHAVIRGDIGRGWGGG